MSLSIHLIGVTERSGVRLLASPPPWAWWCGWRIGSGVGARERGEEEGCVVVCVGGVGERGRGREGGRRRGQRRRLGVDEAPDVDETVYIDSGFLGSGTTSERVKSPSFLVFPAHS